MFERFTERARQVVVCAQDEARALGHNHIGTEHLVLGLLREEEGIGGRVLRSLGAGLDEARAQVQRLAGVGEPVAVQQIPFTPPAKKALELALREALSLGHNYIGTEHVLLGVARVDDDNGARILLAFGLDAERIRDEVIRALGSSGAAGVPGVAHAVPVPRLRVRGARGRRTWEAEPLLVGWALFGVAAGLGVLLGWLIWG